MSAIHEAKLKIEALSQELNLHNHHYYVLSSPLISDAQFDQKLAELQKLEAQFPSLASPNSPTKRVGGDITNTFEVVAHQYPMLSLSNSYSKDEIIQFQQRIQKLTPDPIEYICELKYDGVAISIRYENGVFTRALTRGDGTKGEDISTNVKTIPSIPLVLNGSFPSQVEIRGEIFMPKKAFALLNEQRAAQGEELYMNPRNTTSGTLKQKDSSIVASRKLDSMLYGVYAENLEASTHLKALEQATQWGIKTPLLFPRYIEKHSTIEGIMDFIAYWENARWNLDFDIDGIVIKVNHYKTQDQLGFTSKFPRWAIAFKFASERQKTILKHISYQVGRTGAITPVANLEGVILGGTLVKRASLHNEDQILKFDIREGDTVWVEKGGEIIPKITGVELDSRPSKTEPFQFIKNCPECGIPLTKMEGEAAYYCLNTEGCTPQILGKIEHFIHKKALYIDSIGPETIEQFYTEGLLKDAADLYQLSVADILPLNRMAQKSAENIIAGIEASKNIPFEQVLFGLGIRHVGETVAKKLAKHFKTIENIQNASFEQLTEVEEIGDKIAHSLIEYFSNPKNLDFIARLKQAGLQFEIQQHALLSNVLEGMSIVVTGVFNTFSREEIKKTIEAHGGKNLSSISASTTFVLAGENVGPKKLEKATKLAIRIVNEQEFIEMIS